MNTKQWLPVVLPILIVVGLRPPMGIAADTVHLVGKVYTPIPSYPYTARRNYEQGSGTVRVRFDGAGKVAKVEMVRSTGYEDLDGNVVNFARSHWSGPPNLSVNVPVDYRLGRYITANQRQQVPGQWYTPMPHYPLASLKFLESGSGVVKITTDATGRVNHAEMTQSIGAKRLDENTIHYALGFWDGPPKSTKEIPVTYVMRTPH